MMQGWRQLAASVGFAIAYGLFLYRAFTHGASLSPYVPGGLLMAAIFVQQLALLVSRAWLQRSLTVTYWVVLACSLAGLMRLELMR
jgi:hypothetical protein